MAVIEPFDMSQFLTLFLIIGFAACSIVLHAILDWHDNHLL